MDRTRGVANGLTTVKSESGEGGVVELVETLGEPTREKSEQDPPDYD
ncbi:hypothetical protein J2S43_003501 [Catenuloplanes nepalensis]|uniref:Uncharacterized protein n=1 Tax=Catenuloplanes nepalensis TaxID=587533 RepID=A0ABT9MUE2_9ACTN|nr:hypothetical protein [Catenuloplanes nepalensis]